MNVKFIGIFLFENDMVLVNETEISCECDIIYEKKYSQHAVLSCCVTDFRLFSFLVVVFFSFIFFCFFFLAKNIIAL